MFVLGFIVCCLAGIANAWLEVCYGKYGCFSKNAPFNNLAFLPLPPMVISPAFRLYTRSNTKQPQFINDYDVTKLQNSNYDGAKKTVFVCHGYVEIRPKWMEHIKDGLLRNVDCNVILVDWYRGSFFPYIQAAGNTRLVGAMIAELIKFLIFQTQSSVDLFHIVGFSLGAHVAGYAGSRLKLNGLTLARITGLDPAGPGFSAEDPALRLDHSDARFVDVIHTDANWLGLFHASGHIDFYPNGGLDQAGCSRLTAGFFPFLSPLVCDHFRATAYFIESLSPQCMHAMKGFPCSDHNGFDRARCLACKNGECPDMGYNTAQNGSQILGKHFLYTTKSAPFCVPFYTVVTFKTTSSWLVGLLRAHIVVRLFGSAGETRFAELKSETRGLRRGSDETFLMSGSRDVGSLQKIQVQQKAFPWLLKWKVSKVLVKPGWSGTQADRSNNQPVYSACLNTYVGSNGVVKNLKQGDVSC